MPGARGTQLPARTSPGYLTARIFDPRLLTTLLGPTLVPMAKPLTRDQAERKKQQAAAFMERIGEPDRADEFDDMTVEEYAEHRGFELVANPQRKIRKQTMAAGTKAELSDAIDEAVGILNDAYTPEATREQLAEAIGDALDVLNGDDSDDSDDDSDLDDEEGE